MAEHPPNPKKYLYVGIALLQSGLCSGVIFGWPSLVQLLVQQNVYINLCKEGEKIPCPAQQLRYQLIYTIATFFNNGQGIITGVIMDHLGPKKANIIVCSMFLLGCILFIVSDLGGIDAYFFGYALLGFAGPGIQICLLHISNLFHKQSIVISLFSGMFGVSSAVFKVFELCHTAKFTLGYLFLVYTCLLTVLFVYGFFLWPNRPYSACYKSTQSIAGQETSTLHVSFKKQLFSWEFWAITIYMCIQSLNLIFYVGSVNTIFAETDYISVFAIIYTCGVIVIPFVGYMLDSRGVLITMLCLSCTYVVSGICSLVLNTKLQVITFILVSAENTALFAVFFSYMAIAFGFSDYGKLLGISSLIFAVAGLLEYPLSDVVLKSGNFVFLHLVFTILSLLLIVMNIAMIVWQKKGKFLCTPTAYVPLAQYH